MTAAPPPAGRRAGAILVLAVAMAAAACTSAASVPAADTTPVDPSPAEPGAGVTPAPGAPSARPSDLPVQPPDVATVPPGEAPVTGEAPAAVIDAARTDLAARIGAPAAEAALVVTSQAVEWPDGSLGCRLPGEAYPQVVTPGYRVVLESGGAAYDYRITATGFVRLCEQPLKPNPGG